MEFTQAFRSLLVEHPEVKAYQKFPDKDGCTRVCFYFNEQFEADANKAKRFGAAEPVTLSTLRTI